MAIIQTKGLVKNFGKVYAVDVLNLTTAEGEVHGFLGPNGAGKTTTIRLLLGLIKPKAGSATVFGLDAWGESVNIHKRLAYVPGEVSLWDNMTGGEVIDLFLSMRGISGKKNALKDKYIELFQLDPAKKCGTYSKGNKQKVALVAALASDSELYIFDEPTSGLDPIMEKVFQTSVADLKKQGKSVLLSSHILSEVEKLADSISIIRAGKIVETGSLKDIVARGASLEDLFLSQYEGSAE